MSETTPERSEVERLTEALAAPFDSSEVKFKPAVVSGNRALALPYVTARAVQDRLDEVFGVDGWQDDYTVLPDNSVVCKLEARFGAEWVAKTDVGGPSEQPDEGDRMKAAFSDALKRAAVKLGVGRYLYRVPQQWVDYDPAKRQFTRTPTLPAWALPGPARPPGPASPGHRPAHGPGDPATAAELLPWLDRLDRQLLRQGLTLQPRELHNAVALELGAASGQGLAGLPDARVPAAAETAKTFARQQRERAAGATPQKVG